MEKRKLKDLSRYEMSIIAKEYATSSMLYSGEYFMRKYRISSSTFYNVLHKAILESIVSESVARMIANKAATNNERHGGDGAKGRTLDMYEELIKSRKSYRLQRAEAKKWVLKYLESEFDIETFANRNYLEVSLFKRALHDAVVNSWIDDIKVKQLQEKTKNQKNADIDNAFEKLIEKRNENKAEKKK